MWGDAHEYHSGIWGYGNSGISQAGYSNPQNNGMDLWNNAIGRAYGFASHNMQWNDSLTLSAFRGIVQALVASGADPYETLNPEVPSGTVRTDKTYED